MSNKGRYDKRSHEHTFVRGDLVLWLRGSFKVGISKKLQPVWNGPFVVATEISPILYRVAGRKKEYVVHHDKLKRCNDRLIPLWVRRKQNDILEEEETIGYDRAENEIDLEYPQNDSEISQGDVSHDSTREPSTTIGYDQGENGVEYPQDQSVVPQMGVSQENTRESSFFEVPDQESILAGGPGVIGFESREFNASGGHIEDPPVTRRGRPIRLPERFRE